MRFASAPPRRTSRRRIPVGGRRILELGLVGGVVGLAATLVVVGYRQDQTSAVAASTAPSAQIVVDTDSAPIRPATTNAAPTSVAVAVPAQSTIAPPVLGGDFSSPLIRQIPATTPAPTTSIAATTQAPTTLVPTTRVPATTTVPTTTAPTTTATAPARIDTVSNDTVSNDTVSNDTVSNDTVSIDTVSNDTVSTTPNPVVIGAAPELPAAVPVPKVLFRDVSVAGPVVGTVAIEGLVIDATAAAELRALVEGVFGADRVVDNSAVVPGAAGASLGTIRITEVALFETKSPTIDATILPMLERIVVLLKLAPEATITVTGHTDTLGVPEENDDLSRRRAESVTNYLEFRSISPDRLRAIGAGSGEPIASNDDESGRSQNRRLELVIDNAIAR